MSIKNGFHYDDYNRRYYRDENGDKIPENICLCAAHEPSECCCDCTSCGDCVYDDDALTIAKEAREDMIRSFNLEFGGIYSERHGL